MLLQYERATGRVVGWGFAIREEVERADCEIVEMDTARRPQGDGPFFFDPQTYAIESRASPRVDPLAALRQEVAAISARLDSAETKLRTTGP